MTQPARRTKPIKIQFASDLHLEFERRAEDRLQLPVAPGTRAVVLAGDIHSDIAGMDDFVRTLARHVPVVLVAGNHEYFMHEFESHRERLRDWAASIRDVHFLENASVEIDGVTFLGSTLWSDFDHARPALLKKAPSMMTDYAVISDRSDPRGRLRPSRILDEHRQSLAFLERELRICVPERTVVVTHHAPSLQSTRIKGEDWNVLYGSDCEALIEDCGPTLWIHGHVHQSFEYRVGRTTIACNPRGYLGYGENTRFDAQRTICLEPSRRRTLTSPPTSALRPRSPSPRTPTSPS
jgi:Icc-related predicted phosphoesterase